MIKCINQCVNNCLIHSKKDLGFKKWKGKTVSCGILTTYRVSNGSKWATWNSLSGAVNIQLRCRASTWPCSLNQSISFNDATQQLMSQEWSRSSCPSLWSVLVSSWIGEHVIQTSAGTGFWAWSCSCRTLRGSWQSHIPHEAVLSLSSHQQLICKWSDEIIPLRCRC